MTIVCDKTTLNLASTVLLWYVEMGKVIGGLFLIGFGIFIIFLYTQTRNLSFSSSDELSLGPGGLIFAGIVVMLYGIGYLVSSLYRDKK